MGSFIHSHFYMLLARWSICDGENDSKNTIQMDESEEGMGYKEVERVLFVYLEGYNGK